VHLEKLFDFVGASAPNPDLLFVLTQKVSKKYLTRPTDILSFWRGKKEESV